MARAMEEYGLPIPRFEELGGEFRVTLVGPSADIQLNATWLIW